MCFANKFVVFTNLLSLQIKRDTINMALYECIFIARQDVAAQDVHKLSDKFLDIFAGFGAKLIKKEYWGLRPLGYEVKKNKKGHYIMLGMESSDEGIKEFERNCKINEDVIKFMTIQVEKMDEQPSAMMQAPAKAPIGASSEAINAMMN